MTSFDLPKTEEKILKFWKDRKIFERTLENRKRARRFVFFEGPPYANGRPGIHHFLGRAIKDLFLRYKTMRGYLVARKAGWDTHGLPIEIEAEKRLGIKSKKDIEKIGVGVFNRKARESIWEYKDEWEKFSRRIGFWLDFQNPYITYEPKYIETLWWIISQIAKRKLLYKGHKILPWCPRCGTALASHEVAQGYEDTTEMSVYVRFRVKSKEAEWQNTSILSWTTTPWTLPGNIALAVNPKHKFVCVPDPEQKEHWLVLEQTNFRRLLEKRYFPLDYKNLPEDKTDVFSGKYMVGIQYEPLFNIPRLQTKTAYKVYPADFVTTEDGTGIVHTAVMYGEDDYELGTKLGLPKHHTVDPDGRFTKEVKGFEGQFVKDAERGIIEYLKNRNLLFKTEEYTHSYPFCWRCQSPLIYYARDSWFLAMSKLRKQLVKNNNKVSWVPAHLKHGRFGEFIKEAKDWAVSRERYWGTPLPIWQCGECKNQLVIGSLEELEKYRYRPKNIFYIMRHGLSEKDSNTGGSSITAGKLDKDKYNLRPEGIEQVENTAEKLKELGGVDLIYSSPFLRTRRTADIVAQTLGLRARIDDRLKELDHGSICEGRKHSDLEKLACLLPGTKPMLDTKYGDGESWRDVKKRMFSIVSELDQKYEDKKILMVSHGDPLWILESLAQNFSDEETIAKRESLYTTWGAFKKIELKNYPYNKDGEVDIHRPYADEIYLKCPRCSGSPRFGGAGKMARIKEVADVWFDSGSMPYAQWHYPFEGKRQFAQNFPADFIAEGIDQTRGWFYTLLAVSTLLGKKVPYKNVVSYSHVLDAKSKKMSKSVGNVVDSWEVIEKFGVDAARWYFYTLNDPGDPKLFVINNVGKKLNGFIMTLANSLRFFELYANASKKKLKAKPSGLLDDWILSRLNNLIVEVVHGLDHYDYNKPARAIERFVVEDLSNWWIRRSRERFQKPKNKEELAKVAQFLRFLLIELSKLIAPFAPFLADHIYKKLDNRKESVHLEDWPRAKKKFINPELEKQMSELRGLIAEGLAQRKADGIKVRQPLATITLNRAPKFEFGLEELLLAELNVKKVLYDTNQKEAAILDKKLTANLVQEGYAREVIRQLQDMRKEAGYRLDEKVWGAWDTVNHRNQNHRSTEGLGNTQIEKTMEKYGSEIARTALLNEFNKDRQPKEVFDVEKELELGLQAKIWLGVRK